MKRRRSERGEVEERRGVPEFQRCSRVCWKVIWEGGTQMRKWSLSKEPRSRFWVLESAMAHTWDSSFLATASWMGRT